MDKNNMQIRFIDLFAGIGGIRLGFENAAREIGIKTKCVYTSEIDKYACQTYHKNYSKDNHEPLSDITKVNEKEMPDFDLVLAGFPCQAFSIAGKRGGFEDTRGTLFFDVARLIMEKKPKAFLLENVKGLVNHRGGKTLSTILNVLENDLGYRSTQFKVLNARNYGVPQNRERIYIVGFREGGGGFKFPSTTDDSKTIADIIEKVPVSSRYYLSTTYVSSMRAHKERHAAKGNGFGYEIRPHNGVANAIVCGGMGRERNLLIDNRQKDLVPTTKIKGQINNEGIRRMTPVEWERLQGFPDNWTEGVADVHRYKQLGNSVAVPVIYAIAQNILSELIDPLPFVKKKDIRASQIQLLFDEA
jgi:DNA (cytosine-5)-methyltransferase 1